MRQNELPSIPEIKNRLNIADCDIINYRTVKNRLGLRKSYISALYVCGVINEFHEKLLRKEEIFLAIHRKSS